MLETVASAREAIQRHAWAEAVQAFTQAERQEPLAPDDLLLLGTAAWWDGQMDEAVEAYERAFDRFLEAGQEGQAAIVALRLCELAMRRMNTAVGSGWLARAERLLEDEPESLAHAWLGFIRAIIAVLAKGEFEQAIAHADRSLELARRFDSPDVESLALAVKGQAMLRQGRWSEGLALMDEAAAAAASGRLDPKSACDVYCNTIAACSDLGEYRRAGEWIDEADRWMQRRAISGYRGVCRVHRAELKRLQGAWPEAEQEARDACDELYRFRMLDAVGYAHYEIGEVRLRTGDLTGAEEAFERAHEYGRTPQPGHALLLLAKGDAEAAARSIARALADDGADPFQATDLLQRARLLPAQMEIALATDDLDTARAARDELVAIADRYESETLQASALTARGALHLHEGDGEAAVSALSRAWRAWHRLDLPYESAHARLLLGRARAATGDQATALLEIRAAKGTFERLGAARDLRYVGQLLEDTGDTHATRTTKTFMFTDIVTSTDLVRLIGDDRWKDLITWHDRALRSEISTHHGQEVRHTGDGFLVTFDQPQDAVRCAIAIQRRLTQHRHEHGFAPSVRIGLHTTEATHHGTDYAGHGVHIAARIGDHAQSEQILASEATLEAARPLDVRTAHTQTITPKGADEAIQVHVLQWT